MSKRKPIKKRSLFDPDEVATSINQALMFDLQSGTQVYTGTRDPVLYARQRQAAELMKKYCSMDQDKDRLEAQTFEKFLEVNEHMHQTNRKLYHTLPDPAIHISRQRSDMDKIHLRARALMHFVLTPFSVDEWFTECRNSSGSSVGVPFWDTSPERKLTFPITATEGVQNLFSQYLTFDNALKESMKIFNRQCPLLDEIEIVQGSKATTVDKTTQKRRMIAPEPTANMFLQQGLMIMMYHRMRAVGLDVETLPELHKTLARLASITGRDATIDWSCASDCSAVELIKWLTPPKWFSAVDRTRSHYTKVNGEYVELGMISTMGNAVTFPLESLVFWTYAVATITTKGKFTNSLFPSWEDQRRVSVFGDDCVVPSEYALDIINTLTEVGFIVNSEKSFYGSERFRESCGGDYLAGYDVRPYFLKAPHSVKKSALEPWLYTIANGLLKKYRSYFGDLSYVYDKELWRLLFSLFRENKIEIKLVPSFFPDDAGLKLSYDILRFERHYPMKLSRIDMSKHGTASFRFCSFKYRTTEAWDDGIRLSMWHKKPVQSLRPQVHERNIRRVGGYVVAKGVTCHWYVPSVKEGV